MFLDPQLAAQHTGETLMARVVSFHSCLTTRCTMNVSMLAADGFGVEQRLVTTRTKNGVIVKVWDNCISHLPPPNLFPLPSPLGRWPWCGTTASYDQNQKWVYCKGMGTIVSVTFPLPTYFLSPPL